MKAITRQMLSIYKPISGLDWMNYVLIKKDMTAHHIIKREDGGKLEIPNIALLMPVSHQYLHLIECKDMGTYIALNKVFKVVNNQGYEPTKEQRQLIECLLREFEDIHRWDIGSKGKILIKEKYLQRKQID